MRQEELTSLRAAAEEGAKQQVITGDKKRRRHEAEAVGSVKLKKKLYYIRTQLRSGKTVSGRALQEQELTSLRAQEVELVKKLFWMRRCMGTTLRMMELGEELKEPSGLTLTEEASASAATVVAPSGEGLLACLRVS